MHYGACWRHVTSVAERARRDAAQIDDADRARAFRVAAEQADVLELGLGELEP
jgi:hypothetical protein